MKKLLLISLLITNCGTEHDYEFARNDLDRAELVQVCLYDDTGLILDYDTVYETLIPEDYVECTFFEN